nr:hypothetical protein [Tanacetum cinerariifolium]
IGIAEQRDKSLNSLANAASLHISDTKVIVTFPGVTSSSENSSRVTSSSENSSRVTSSSENSSRVTSSSENSSHATCYLWKPAIYGNLLFMET